jgi:hypothetical protein
MTDWLLEAARRPIAPPAELPDGLEMMDGRPHFQCRVCEKWTEWEVDPADFVAGVAENVCGGSPWCCP